MNVHAGIVGNGVFNSVRLDPKTGYYIKRKKKTSKKYLLINPPVSGTIEFRFHNNKFSPGPVGLLRVANYLYSNNNYVRFFDFNPVFIRRSKWKRVRVSLFRTKQLFYFGKKIKEMEDNIRGIEAPDEILFGSYMTYSCSFFKILIRRLRKLYPHAKIVFGGPVANLIPKEMQAIGFDKVHAGPYNNADEYYPLYDIMDKLPEYATLRLTKGCPKNCSYCAVPLIEGRMIRNFGYKKLKNEFNHFMKLGFKKFTFWDANILYAKKDIYKFLDYIAAKKLDIEIDFQYGLDFQLLDDEMINKFEKANLLKYTVVPLESSIKSTYKKRFHKTNQHLVNIDNNIKRLQKNGYFLGFYVILGMPKQKVDEILETLYYGLVRGCEAYLMPFSLIPKTEEYKKYKHLLKNKRLDETNPNLFPFRSHLASFNDCQEIFDIFHMKILVKKKDVYFLYNFRDNSILPLGKPKFYHRPYKIINKFSKLVYSRNPKLYHDISRK